MLVIFNQCGFMGVAPGGRYDWESGQAVRQIIKT